MGEQREDHPAEQTIGERAGVMTLDLRARRFDQLVVLHARWARGEARHAAEAMVEMADVGIRHLRVAFGAELHQVDPPARGIHFLPPGEVGRAGGEAEAAVHALVDQRRRRRVLRVEDRDRRHYTPPTNRPGESVPWGSSCCLTRCSTAKAPPRGPHTPDRGFKSSGATNTTSV